MVIEVTPHGDQDHQQKCEQKQWVRMGLLGHEEIIT
jgi:hypothetical protein